MRNDNKGDSNRIRRKKVSSSDRPASSSSGRSSRTPSSNRSKNTRKRKLSGKKLFKKGFLIAMIVFIAGVAGVTFSSLKDIVHIDERELDTRTHVTTTILYANGEKMSTAPTSNKKVPVTSDEISPYLKDAIVAIEDQRFYEHHGVDIKGLVRSVVKTFTGDRQGGSTLEMQTSKMLLTNSEQTVTRKIKDIYYATRIDKAVSKEKALEIYLNNFSVGKGFSGAEAGARGYFNKSAKDLTLAESALLAGSTKNPSKYSAYKTAKLDGTETKEDLQNKIVTFIDSDEADLDDASETELKMIDKVYSWGLIDADEYKLLKNGTTVIRKAVNNPDAKERQEVVLQKMKEQGYITDSEYKEALAEEIKISLPKDDNKISTSVEDVIANEVITALMEEGNTREEASDMYYNGGLVINTTIDPKIQDSIEKEYKNNNNFPGNIVGPDGVHQPQSASVIIDYRSGSIKGIVGGRNITASRTLNRALTPRQPGSTIKPLAIYTPAIDTGKITQATAFSDVRGGYRFEENRKWNPKTTTSGSGSMSLRLGLAKSSNTVAVKVAELLGSSYEDSVDIMLDYLNNFGISTLSDNKATSDSNNTDRTFPALTLGGLTYGISPLELATAYGVFANGGEYVEPTIFTTVTSYNNEVVVEAKQEKHKVIDPEVAYVMTDMLKAVVNEGTAGKAKLPNGMPVAGKTGTTNSSKEAWFVGFTPYYVGATYIADDPGVRDASGKIVKTRNIGGGSSSATNLWKNIMTSVHSKLNKKDFDIPDGVHFESINLRDGGASSGGSKAAFLEGTSASRISTLPNNSSSGSSDGARENQNTSGEGAGGGNDGNNGNGNTDDTTTPAEPPADGGNDSEAPDDGGGAGGNDAAGGETGE